MGMDIIVQLGQVAGLCYIKAEEASTLKLGHLTKFLVIDTVVITTGMVLDIILESRTIFKEYVCAGQIQLSEPAQPSERGQLLNQPQIPQHQNNLKGNGFY